MLTAGDLSALFQTGEGTVVASFGGSTFNVRMLRAYQEAGGFSGYLPAAQALTSDVSGLAPGDSGTVDGDSFTVVRVEHAGFGVSDVYLEEA